MLYTIHNDCKWLFLKRNKLNENNCFCNRKNDKWNEIKTETGDRIMNFIHSIHFYNFKQNKLNFTNDL